MLTRRGFAGFASFGGLGTRHALMGIMMLPNARQIGQRPWRLPREQCAQLAEIPHHHVEEAES